MLVTLQLFELTTDLRHAALLRLKSFHLNTARLSILQQLTLEFFVLSALQFGFLKGSILVSRGSGELRLFLFM
jgi:hypothetical protein